MVLSKFCWANHYQIKVLEYLFDDGDGGLNIHFLREVMNQSYIT